MSRTGTWRREEIVVGERTTADAVVVKSWVYESARPGPSVYIQANVHGSEIAGVGAIFELFRILAGEKIRGTLRIVPHANPWSVNERVGEYTQGVYDVATGRNWNRSYRLLAEITKGRGRAAAGRIDVKAFARANRRASWPKIRSSYRALLVRALEAARLESAAWHLALPDRLALALQSWAVCADLVLDLHTGDTAPHYLYYPAYARPLALEFGIPFLLEIGNDFGGALDESVFCPWFSLMEALEREGKTLVPDVAGFTVELGSMDRIEPIQMRADAERIAGVLRLVGLLGRGGESTPRPPAFFTSAIADYRSFQAERGGLLITDVAPGTPVLAGERIGSLLHLGDLEDPRRPESARHEVTSPSDGILLLWHASRIIRQGDRLCSIMTNVRAD